MNKKSFSALISASILGLSLSTSANANLIENGGFEDQTGTALGGDGTSWFIYSASDLSWGGDNIEVWTTRTPSAFEGDYHAELNADGSNTGAWSIFQTFTTIIGQTYDVFFAYSARSGDNEEFTVAFNGTTFTLNDHVVGSWSTFSKSFMATGNKTTLTFTSVVPLDGTLGNFIDDVQVNVPEPSAVALLGLGLLGLGVARKRNKRA
ncbi:MAG: hypothetical protein ACI9FO_001284 [Methylophagaceae bacterium]|jgi:hypothetical protein